MCIRDSLRTYVRTYVQSNLARPERNLIAEGSFKDSRQKRLVLIHRKYNLKTAIQQYYIDRTANRLISLGGTNLDSLSSREHTTSYVQSNLARPAHLGTKEKFLKDELLQFSHPHNA